MATAEAVLTGQFRIISKPARKGRKAPLYMELLCAVKALEPGKAVEIDISEYGNTRGAVYQLLRLYARKAQIDISASKTGDRTMAIWRKESRLEQLTGE